MSKILLNGLHYEKNGAGISKYTKMLLQTFIEEKYDVDILIRNEFKNEFRSDNVIVVDNKINGSKDRILYEQLKADMMYRNYDLIHFPDYATPVFYKKSKIATIHDMAMHTMKDKYTLMQNITKNIFLKNTIKHAEKLICVSEFAKKELLRYYPKVENKTKVIYEGISIPNIKFSNDEEIKALIKFNLKDTNFILYVGTIAPHKNIKNLIRAFNHIQKEIPDYRLVIAGKKGWMYDDVFEEVEKLKLQDKIVFTDFITDIELEVLYKNASLFTSVSFYEGFGFPPLEAIARNLPVVISNIEIFRETCEESAVYCNPNEIEDIGANMLKVLKDNKLQKYLINNGSRRIQTFDWKNTARETYELYQELL